MKTPSRKSSGRAFPIWSGREDLNLRPPEPHSGALPGCATARCYYGAKSFEYSGSTSPVSRLAGVAWDGFRPPEPAVQLRPSESEPFVASGRPFAVPAPDDP